MGKINNRFITKRIGEILAENGLSENRTAKMIKLPQKTVYNQLNDNSKISIETILGISDLFPDISLTWIMKGEGNKYIGDDSPKGIKVIMNDSEEPYEKTKKQKGIQKDPIECDIYLLPVFNLDLINHPDSNSNKSTGKNVIYIPFTNARKEDIAAVVNGQSMSPTYPSGCYIQIREIKAWQNIIEFGQVYVIELKDDRRLLKEIRKGEKEEHYKLISHHPGFDEIEVPISFIRSVRMVIAKYERPVM